MTTYNATIKDAAGNDPARGDHAAIVRTVTSVPAGDTIDKAWLTIKAELGDGYPILLQISVTPATNLSTVGRITDTGADGTAGFQINIQPADYAALQADIKYVYDLQVRTLAGIISTLERGTVKFKQDVTTTTA